MESTGNKYPYQMAVEELYKVLTLVCPLEKLECIGNISLADAIRTLIGLASQDDIVETINTPHIFKRDSGSREKCRHWCPGLRHGACILIRQC